MNTQLTAATSGPLRNTLVARIYACAAIIRLELEVNPDQNIVGLELLKLRRLCSRYLAVNRRFPRRRRDPIHSSQTAACPTANLAFRICYRWDHLTTLTNSQLSDWLSG